MDVGLIAAVLLLLIAFALILAVAGRARRRAEHERTFSDAQRGHGARGRRAFYG
jgi:hypothetical protein